MRRGFDPVLDRVLSGKAVDGRPDQRMGLRRLRRSHPSLRCLFDLDGSCVLERKKGKIKRAERLFFYWFRERDALLERDRSFFPDTINTTHLIPSPGRKGTTQNDKAEMKSTPA